VRPLDPNVEFEPIRGPYDAGTDYVLAHVNPAGYSDYIVSRYYYYYYSHPVASDRSSAYGQSAKAQFGVEFINESTWTVSAGLQKNVRGIDGGIEVVAEARSSDQQAHLFESPLISAHDDEKVEVVLYLEEAVIYKEQRTVRVWDDGGEASLTPWSDVRIDSRYWTGEIDHLVYHHQRAWLDPDSEQRDRFSRTVEPIASPQRGGIDPIAWPDEPDDDPLFS